MTRIAPQQRETVRRVARRLHLEAPMRYVYERLEPAAKRDRIDNEHIRLLLAGWLPADANCIDVGAHGGVILREIVRCAPLGRHIAFEPLPSFAADLAHEFPTVDVRSMALSNRSGRETFYVMQADPMQSGLKLRTGAAAADSVPIEVAVESLDNCLPEGYEPAFIKIDVEGGERQVLEGALNTISTCKPVVCFEHGPGAELEYGTSPEAVYDLLVAEAELRIFDIDGNGPYSRQQFVETYHLPIWNFVAHR